MKLEPQNAQEATKLKTNTAKDQTRQKRERRKAPRYTLVWTEEVQTLRDISTDEVIELRKKALWRIGLAEAVRNNDPAIAKFGASAEIDDLVWSKFKVGKHWFILDFRPATIREYVVNLTTPPSDDIPPPPGKARREDCDDAAPQKRSEQPSQPKYGGDVENALIATRDIGLRTGITVIWRFTRRKLNRCLALYKTSIRARLGEVPPQLGDLYRNVAYNTRVVGASMCGVMQRCASTIATRSISFTRMREPPAQQVSFEAHLEPRRVGQRSGIHILLYSWIRDEPPPVDWGADLFGVLPIDWAANLFGALPEEERAVT